MTDESAYERLRRAQHELGTPERSVTKPIEETEEVAAAIADEAPVPGLAAEAPDDETAEDEAAEEEGVDGAVRPIEVEPPDDPETSTLNLGRSHDAE